MHGNERLLNSRPRQTGPTSAPSELQDPRTRSMDLIDTFSGRPLQIQMGGHVARMDDACLITNHPILSPGCESNTPADAARMLGHFLVTLPRGKDGNQNLKYARSVSSFPWRVNGQSTCNRSPRLSRSDGINGIKVYYGRIHAVSRHPSNTLRGTMAPRRLGGAASCRAQWSGPEPARPCPETCWRPATSQRSWSPHWCGAVVGGRHTPFLGDERQPSPHLPPSSPR